MTFKEIMLTHNCDLSHVMNKLINDKQGNKVQSLLKNISDEFHKSETTPIVDIHVARIILNREIDDVIKYIPTMHNSYKEKNYDDVSFTITLLMNGVHVCFISLLEQYSRLLEECVDNVDPLIQKQMAALWLKDKEKIQINIMSILNKIAEKVEEKK